ncbi:MAG: hypothetical protein AAGC93_08925 [Cyanobacteria bacterium P01_F01_bin.53]
MDNIKQTLRSLLQQTLRVAQRRPAAERRQLVRTKLSHIQTYCQEIDKVFIVREVRITCDQYDLGGHQQQRATLFHGPSDDASVAICVTDKGSLLHRNDSLWRVYYNAGDVAPVTDMPATDMGETIAA